MLRTSFTDLMATDLLVVGAREAGTQFGTALLACPSALNAERPLRGRG